VLTFIYTRCQTACPLTTATISRSLELLGKDADTVRVVAITVDPEHDTPAEMRAYLERYHLDPRWRLLGGTPGEVMPVVQGYHAEPLAQAAALDLASPTDHEGHVAAPPDEVLHPTMVLLIDADGNQRYAYGPGFAPDDLAHDIDLLQRDMGGPTVPFPLY
jgi:cytochrome oxidase Cu insertion factor (SCO1/SenC/PrrC family)